MESISDYHKLKKCKKKAEEKNDLKELASVCNALGELLSQYGYQEEAIAEHEIEKRVSEALQDKIGQAVACRKIGECLCKLGQFDKALQFQNQYLSLAQECNDQVEIQRALATLGDTYYNQADTQGADSSRRLLDQAERKFLQALRVCSELRGSSTLTESENMAMKGRLLLNLGLVYDLRGAEKESSEYLQKALTIAKQWHLEEEQYLCHFNLATQALHHGQPAAAQQFLQLALMSATRLQNKPRQKEVYCQLAIATVSGRDTKAAKHFLKKAYKLFPRAEESHKLIKLYKAVTAVEELSERQLACNEDDPEVFSIHEKLGDAFTEIGTYCGSYATAIEHYQLMVECGERLGLGTDKLIPAYVSLAQTYADNRQPDLAISSYHKELQLRGEDHEQICRTLLNIAELEEKRGDGYKVLSKTYMSAFTNAKKANHPKLQVQVLRSLIATQEVFKEQRHKEQTEAKLSQVLAKYGMKAEEGTSEEEDGQPQDDNATPESDLEADLSISDLTESDKSDEENVRPVLSQPVGTTRVRRHKTFKKNEKGETPLHVACINGNLKRVKTLLEQGHPVNVRDNCGWTPLHEAANHDFPSVVEMLLEAGADINDRGGAECKGVTPLIDAAACGNLDVVRILIEQGANVLARDDKGCTALQAMRDWYRDYADATDQDFVTHYHAVELLLQGKMSGDVSRKAPTSNKGDMHGTSGSLRQSGPRNPAVTGGAAKSRTQNTARSKHRSAAEGSCSRSVSNNIAPRPLLDDSASSEEEEVYRNPQLDNLGISSQSATETYRTSILALGSSTQRAEVRASVSKPVSRSQRYAPRPALIDEREMVGDDWLIDDLQPSNRKRRDHSSLSGMLSSDSVRQAREHKRARLTTKHRASVAGLGSRDTIHTSDTEDRCYDNRPSLSNEDTHHENVLSSQDEDSCHDSRFLSSTQFTNSGTYHVDSRHSGSSYEEESLPVLSHNMRRTERCLQPAHNSVDTELAGEGEANRRLSGGQEQQGTHQSQYQPVVDTGGLFTSSHPAAAPAQLARVKVRIEGSVFLIPLSSGEERTVGWLSEEASQRYSSHFGRRPFLTLSSSDGAILCTEDVLSAVITKDEQLDGTVHGWDQAALSDRYAQACKTLNTVKYRNISGILREAETSRHLSLSGLGLRSTVLLPIARALRGETTLIQLHLPDNHLGDNGLKALVTSLGDLRVLTHLSLSGNGITAAGFKHLADLFPATGDHEMTSSASVLLQMLETLDLSHNPLGNGIADSLCHVVKGLPLLTALMMSSCGLTAKLFQHNRPALAACLQGSSIQQLDVSYNHLGSLGVELLLMSFNAQRLTSLDLGHTCSDSSSGHLAIHLKVFVSQDCALQSLSLENCSLNQEDVDFICRLPEAVPSLQKLNLSVNKAVTRDSLQMLLDSSTQCAHSQLHSLQAQSCSLASPLAAPSSIRIPGPSSSFLEALKNKLSSFHPLQHLSLPWGGLDKMDCDSVRELWTERWAQAMVEFSAQSVVLALK